VNKYNIFPFSISRLAIAVPQLTQIQSLKDSEIPSIVNKPDQSTQNFSNRLPFLGLVLYFN